MLTGWYLLSIGVYINQSTRHTKPGDPNLSIAGIITIALITPGTLLLTYMSEQ